MTKNVYFKLFLLNLLLLAHSRSFHLYLICILSLWGIENVCCHAIEVHMAPWSLRFSTISLVVWRKSYILKHALKSNTLKPVYCHFARYHTVFPVLAQYFSDGVAISWSRWSLPASSTQRPRSKNATIISQGSNWADIRVWAKFQVIPKYKAKEVHQRTRTFLCDPRQE